MTYIRADVAKAQLGDIIDLLQPISQFVFLDITRARHKTQLGNNQLKVSQHDTLKSEMVTCQNNDSFVTRPVSSPPATNS